MANNDDLDRLVRDDNGDVTKPQAKSYFMHRRQKIVGICASLRKPCEEYSPEETLESIRDYMSEGDRIIYSEITSIVYTMPSEEQATFNSNLEALVDYALNEEFKDSKDMQDIQDAVIRLWDHVHLAMRQVGNAKEILEKSTVEVKQSLHDELHDELYSKLYDEFKGIEKEYITILGIFSSIIISFVAGITFSTSVLENMNSVGIYRLVLVILLIAFVMLNAINLLVRYIFRLNKADSAKFPMWQIDLILASLLVLLLICWILNLDQLPEFISQFLPWIE